MALLGHVEDVGLCERPVLVDAVQTDQEVVVADLAGADASDDDGIVPGDVHVVPLAVVHVDQVPHVPLGSCIVDPCPPDADRLDAVHGAEVLHRTGVSLADALLVDQCPVDVPAVLGLQIGEVLHEEIVDDLDLVVGVSALRQLLVQGLHGVQYHGAHVLVLALRDRIRDLVLSSGGIAHYDLGLVQLEQVLPLQPYC